MVNENINELFCQYCPCAGRCDGNAKGNKDTTGYTFIPDPDHCKKMFELEHELTYVEFFTGVMEIHGSTINRDWLRFVNGGDNNDQC